MLYNSFEDYMDNHIVLTRFKDLVDLEKNINENLMGTKNCKSLFVKDIAYKSYYDNDYQDYEVMVCIGNDNEDLYDVTLYYCVSRYNEKVVVESNWCEV